MDYYYKILGCSVDIVTGYGLNERGAEFESREDQEFSFLHIVQNGSDAHRTQYPMRYVGCLPGDKAAEASSWPVTSKLVPTSI
jgi:hypothetical protein